MIELKKISVIFNQGQAIENQVLKELDLTIKRGDFITIIGGNGAGKSTLMNVLSGETMPQAGGVFFDGIDVTKLRTSTRAGYVSRIFQDPLMGSCANLSIEENLALADFRGKERGLGFALNKERREYYRGLLVELGIGLEDRLGDPIGLLSGGQRQAVSLLMATLQPSKVLLLDEHTAALDPKMAVKVMELTVKLVARYGLTALMITHHMTHALQYGNRTLLMEGGRIAQDFSGEKRKALKPKDLLELFEL